MDTFRKGYLLGHQENLILIMQKFRVLCINAKHAEGI